MYSWKSASDLKGVFGDGAAMGIIRSPDNVVAFRLAKPSYHRQDLADYVATKGPIPVDSQISAELSTVLLSHSTYLWNLAKGCIPDYGVRIRFEKDDASVDVLLCFQCDILTVYSNGKPVGSEDFDDGRTILSSLTKKE